MIYIEMKLQSLHKNVQGNNSVVVNGEYRKTNMIKGGEKYSLWSKTSLLSYIILYFE